MSPASLAVITNSFNRRDLIEGALTSLFISLRTLPFNSAVVVFDAGSTDGSQAFICEIAAQFPDIPLHLIQPSSPGKSSFADGCNQAISHAQTLFPDLQWCLFYETDNQFRNPRALADAFQFLDAHPSLGGVGFTVEHSNGQKTGYGCRFPSALSFVLGQSLASRFHLDAPNALEWQHSTLGIRWRLCDVVFTSPLLIRLKVWTESGPMDTDFFPFTDSDLEWCWRAHKKGWNMAVLDLLGVIHDNGGAISKWSARRVLWFHQSRLRLLRRIRPHTSSFIMPFLFLRHLLEILLLSLNSLRSPQAKQSLKIRLKLLRNLASGYEFDFQS